MSLPLATLTVTGKVASTPLIDEVAFTLTENEVGAVNQPALSTGLLAAFKAALTSATTAFWSGICDTALPFETW